MSKIKLGLAGIGKIARDQHLPLLADHAEFELVATASRNASIDGLTSYQSLAELLDREPDIRAISLCTPPGARERDARLALERGVHVLLEKPPAASLGAARDLLARAERSILVASWHSRHAPAVEAARHWLATRQLSKADIAWREDIRTWHPNQDWILEPGGMGVFDPGINALSILTSLIPEAIVLENAALAFPSNRQAPLAAELSLATRSGVPIHAAFDFLQTGAQTWDIRLLAGDEELLLSEGGARMAVDGVQHSIEATTHHEYRGVYANFADRVRCGAHDFDLRPLEIVADAFMLGRRSTLAAFSF